MNAEQKKRIAHEISNWKNACNCRAVQLTGDRMAALLQELIDAPAPSVPDVATATNPSQISSLAEPVAWMYEDNFGTHFTEDYSKFPNNPGILSFTPLYGGAQPAPSVPPVRSTGQWESSRIADYNQGWNDCRGITEKALNDLEKRK